MKRVVLALTALCLAAPALAQEAPPPRKMPRTPVQRQTITSGSSKTTAPPRHVEGPATIIDGDRLRVGGFDLRLFGIVPPQLSASFGPQARAAVDGLAAGKPVSCAIRDRDRDGRLLATCRNTSDADLALELLRRGLAVAARGSLASADFAQSYLAAERNAQAQKIGLWSVTTSAPAPGRETVKTTVAVTPPETADAAGNGAKEETPPAAINSEETPVKAVEAPSPVSASAIIVDDLIGTGAALVPPPEPGFMERYQLLVTGFIMLATALGIMAVLVIQRRRDTRAEMRAIAAALRGELMAARAVGQARIKLLAAEGEERVSWPRIRTTLYQAYVGRLGWLGAELARQIASIYGQSSDYAAYYDGDDEARSQTMPKRQALQILVQHIDEVLPRLALIEQTGQPSNIRYMPPMKSSPVPVPRPASTPAPEVSESQVEGKAVLGDIIPEAEVQTPAPAPTAPSPRQLLNAVLNLARRPTPEKKQAAAKTPDDLVADYTAMIEEEMKRFSFGLGDDESEPPANVARFRNPNN